jgi:radical SAM protein with 4Fe4S-binding SPASM domain
MPKDKLIPNHIKIENVSGLCNIRCIMCPIEKKKRKMIMNNEVFIKILQNLQPYLSDQEFLSFCGFGEPLIDIKVHEKVLIAKEMGFKGIGIYTNGTLLTKDMSKNLLNAKLDTILISIDGFTKKTQESIRVGSNLNEIISNIECFIELRKNSKSKTRIVISFTKQELNKHEKIDFFNFWKKKLKDIYNDSIFFYEAHNCRDLVFVNNDKHLESLKYNVTLNCTDINKHLTILANGSVVLCCADLFDHFNIGNAINNDPIELFNSKYFHQYRKAMHDGEILKLELCKKCTVPYSLATKNIDS